MTCQSDFNEAWERLDAKELDVVVHSLTRMQESRLAPRLREMLLSTAYQELGYRSDLRSKADAVNLPALSSGELAQAWHGALCLQRCLIFTPVLIEWAGLLMTAVCHEMASRLDAMEKLDAVIGQAGSN